jgi:hypothetical protein
MSNQLTMQLTMTQNQQLPSKSRQMLALPMSLNKLAQLAKQYLNIALN